MAKIHEICKGNLWGASFETASIRSTVRLFCSIFKRRQVASTSRSVCLSVGRSVCPQNEIQKATNNICTQKLHMIKPSLRRGLSRLFSITKKMKQLFLQSRSIESKGLSNRSTLFYLRTPLQREHGLNPHKYISDVSNSL